MKSILTLLVSFYFINLFSQAINVTFENRDISGNTWTFDLVANVQNTYIGPSSNWSGANVRTNIEVPSGVTITSVSGTPVHSSVLAATGQTSFSGGTVSGTVKYGVFLERNAAQPDLTPGSTVTLATMSVTFSSAVPASNLVSPRAFGVSAQSFWNTLSNPDALPFGLPAPFPLPIDIKTFSATKDGDRNARLDWSTSLEINSAYFGIERSTDGNTWELLDQVLAAGNSNTEQFYTYTDRDLPLNRSKDQIFYYRLQLVDLDGQYKYSDIRGVNFGKENTNKVISLYPNPAVQMVNLDLSGMDLESGAIHLRVTDMQGRNMIDKTILGNGIEPIEVTQLPAGTYNVAVSQGANLYQKQFIKIE